MKTIIFILLISVNCLIAQDINFNYKLPTFMKGTQIQYGKNIQFCVTKNKVKMIAMSAPCDLNVGLKQIDASGDFPGKKHWISKVIIVDSSNNIVFEKKYLHHVWIDSLESPDRLMFMVTKTNVVSNELIPYEVELRTDEGNLYKTIKVEADNIFKSINEDSFFCNDKEIDFSKTFYIYSLDDNQGSSYGKTLAVANRVVNFQKPPTGFILVGGPNLEFIASFNRVIWMTSLNDSKHYWQIDDIGSNINGIYYVGMNLIGVETELGFNIIDIKSGKVLISFDRQSKEIKENNINWGKTKVENNSIVLDSFGTTKIIIKNIDLHNAKTYGYASAYIVHKSIPSKISGITKQVGSRKYSLKIKNNILYVSTSIKKKSIAPFEGNDINLLQLIR